MSKAFTRESDLEGDFQDFTPPPTLPPGAKNYMTPEGEKRLRGELDRLIELDQRRRTGSSGDAAPLRGLEALDRRIARLRQCLQTAVVVPPPDPSEEQVRFGASVLVREADGEEFSYRIVGVDETDPDAGWVSWLSPIARALTNARKGDRIQIKLPGGNRTLEILAISYQ